jgi:hypothetical protein
MLLAALLHTVVVSLKKKSTFAYCHTIHIQYLLLLLKVRGEGILCGSTKCDLLQNVGK